VRRALTLDRRLAGAAPAGRAATAALDRLAAAILVLNDDGSLHLANRSAEALLQTGEGLGLSRQGQLRGADPGVTAQLTQAIEQAAAARRDGSIDQAGSIVLRREGRQPLSALVVPMPREGSRFGFAGDEGGAVMVVVTDPEQAPAPIADWLRERFRLTPAEQRLVECLVTGMRLEDAADRLVISRETARTRLKQVMIKTDCDRQSELIRLVLSAPGSLIYT
jgi:DNA-binding CsgD family transcriptional regulator